MSAAAYMYCKLRSLRSPLVALESLTAPLMCKSYYVVVREYNVSPVLSSKSRFLRDLYVICESDDGDREPDY